MSDSDDLSMSESEVGKLAVSIEKEMFNLYMNTDSKYKNKYRSLMFNLKDPKNKVGQQFYDFQYHRTFLKNIREQDVFMSAVCSTGFVLSCDWWRGQPISVSETQP